MSAWQELLSSRTVCDHLFCEDPYLLRNNPTLQWCFIADTKATLHLEAECWSWAACSSAVGLCYCEQFVWPTGHLSIDACAHTSSG